MDNAREFGIELGSAYQILDDCGDYLGLDTTKGMFNDIKAGVITLPMIYLLGKCTTDEKRKIIKMVKQ